MKVRDVMTTEVVTTGPDATLKEVATLLLVRRISGLPVVDERRQVLGVVSEADILAKERTVEPTGRGAIAWLLVGAGDFEERLAARTVGEAMTSPPVVIHADRPLGEAAARMLDERVNRLPVIDRGELVGIVTRADLVRAFVRPDDQIAREIREDVLRRTLWISTDDVWVHVDQGEVTLEGTVETRMEAEIVEALVARVPAVVSVRSSLGWREDDRFHILAERQ